jgi:hypothetical protein
MTSKSEQQILLQHVMALKRLAKIGSPLYGNTPTHEQIDPSVKMSQAKLVVSCIITHSPKEVAYCEKRCPGYWICPVFWLNHRKDAK